MGAGLPAPGSTHEIAQKISRACQVVYADNDPLVIAHGRALLTGLTGAQPCSYLHGDIREPGALLAAAGAVLDFSRPIAVLLLSVLHFVSNDDDPAGIIAELAAALAPGSLIAISHLTADYAPQAVTDGVAAYNARVPVQIHSRSRDGLAAMCGALPLTHPGIVPVNYWLRSLRDPAGPAADLHAAALRLPFPASAPGVSPTPALTRPQPSPQERAAEMERAAARHPAYEITTDLSSGRLRDFARARSLGTHLYLVITATVGELLSELRPEPV